jgi:hypothetical protein
MADHLTIFKATRLFRFLMELMTDAHVRHSVEKMGADLLPDYHVTRSPIPCSSAWNRILRATFERGKKIQIEIR